MTRARVLSKATWAMTLLIAGTALAQSPAAPPSVAPVNTRPLYVATYIEALPGARDEAAAVLKTYREASRSEPGNLRALVVRSTVRPGQFVLLTTWQDETAWERHLVSPRIVESRAKLAALRSAPLDDRLNGVLSVGPLDDAGSTAAVYVVTHVDVAPPHREATMAALKTLAEANRKANGNLRYESVQQANRPNHFTVFEIWRSRELFDANVAAPAQREFRDKLWSMTGALYDERLYELLK